MMLALMGEVRFQSVEEHQLVGRHAEQSAQCDPRKIFPVRPIPLGPAPKQKEQETRTEYPDQYKGRRFDPYGHHFFCPDVVDAVSECNHPQRQMRPYGL